MLRNSPTNKGTKKKNVIALIQARMDSIRLPRKIMKLIDGKPMISRVLEALSKSSQINRIVVVTSDEKTDDPLVEFLKKNNIAYFRGSKTDVLDRYYQASSKFKADIIVRITGDCPLIDPDVVDNVIESINNDLDYVSNVGIRTFPRGYDVEVFTYDLLKKLHSITTDIDDREHVTLYVRRNPQLFRVSNMIAPQSKHHPEWRICVDTIEDLNLVRKIFATCGKKSTIHYDDIIEFFKMHPKLEKINKKIQQKKINNQTF